MAAIGVREAPGSSVPGWGLPCRDLSFWAKACCSLHRELNWIQRGINLNFLISIQEFKNRVHIYHDLGELQQML